MKKAKFFKYFFILSSIVVVLFAVSAVLVYHYFPKDKILSLVINGAQETLKRKVTIKEIDYGIQGITLKNINIYNNLNYDNSIPDDDLFASVREAKIQFSLLPLLRKELSVSRIILDNFKIIIFFENGKSNLGIFFNDLKSGKESGVKTRVSSIRFINAEITLKDPVEVLKPLEGKYIFNGTLDIPQDKLVSISDVDVVLPSDRGIISSDRVLVSLPENNFEVSGDYRLKKCSLLWVYKWANSLSLPYTNFTGDIKNLRISKTFVEGYANGKSVLTNSGIVNASGKCRVDISKKTISLIKINGEIRKSKFLVNEILLTFSKKSKQVLLKFGVSDIDADVDDLKGILTFLPENIISKIYGNVAGDISFENNSYNGSFDLKEVAYKSDNKEIIKINTDILIKNNVIFKENAPVIILGQQCLVSVSTSGNNFQKIILNISAKDFKYLIKRQKTAGKIFSKLKIKSSIMGNIDCENLDLNKFNFTNVMVNYSFVEGRLTLNQTAANFMGGAVKGNGYIDVFGEHPYIDILLNFAGIKVQNIASLKDQYSGRVFGVANGNANIEFGMDKDASVFDSLKGKIEFNIDKGKLVNTGIQKGLGIWLSELKYKLNNIEFSKIYGNINVVGNDFYINSVLFNAPDIRLKMDGNVSWPEDMNTIKIPGKLNIDLEFSDFFIQDIPNLPQAQFLGIPALKKKGGWYVMSFQDKGDDITDSKNIKPL